MSLRTECTDSHNKRHDLSSFFVRNVVLYIKKTNRYLVFEYEIFFFSIATYLPLVANSAEKGLAKYGAH